MSSQPFLRQPDVQAPDHFVVGEPVGMGRVAGALLRSIQQRPTIEAFRAWP